MLTESAKQIKIMRIGLGLNQHEFAKKFHFGLRGLQAWEQGRTKPPAHVLYLVPKIVSLESSNASLTQKNDDLTAKNKSLQEALGKAKDKVSELEARVTRLEAESAAAGCSGT